MMEKAIFSQTISFINFSNSVNLLRLSDAYVHQQILIKSQVKSEKKNALKMLSASASKF